MQVSHVQDHVTHAVIGGGATQSFGISSSAEFFNILSNTLYSDKIGAVCRETLCNAWDAHILSGRTDLPVVVTFKDGELTIRDRGPGIPAEDMHTRYCIYGGSDKKHDGRQTGGFGLGCKAPFAYVDHFEVTSFNGGTRTIYRISKTSGEVDGKPGLTPIVSTPTDEHGLQVKLKYEQRDYTRFKEVLTLIARVGEMNVTINGVLVETLPFSKAEQGFLMTAEGVTAMRTNHRVFIRYGNVGYPIEPNEKYDRLLRSQIDLLDQLRNEYGNTNMKLVLLAQPHTISVTPSREALSMTDLTVGTITQLLTDFDSLRRKHMEAEALKLAKKRVEMAWDEMRPAMLLNVNRTLFSPSFNQARYPKSNRELIVSMEGVCLAYVSRQYPKFTNFWRNDLEMRLRSLIQGGFGNRGKIQSFLSDFLKPTGPYPRHSPTWFHRRVVAPLVMGLNKDPHLSPDRLMVYGQSDRREIGRRYSYREISFHEASKFMRDSLDDYIPFLRNLVILAYNRNSVEERAETHPAFARYFGSSRNSLVYVVQRNDTKVEAARAFFQQQGMYVVDLTKRQAGEPETVNEVTNIREYKPRKKGIPMLSTIMVDSRISTDLAKIDDAKRIEKPEFVIKISNRNDAPYLDGFDMATSKDIVTLFGARGGIVVNQSQMDKYKALGAEEFNKWVTPILMEELQTNPRIQQNYSVQYGRSRAKIGGALSYDREQILGIALGDSVLSTYFDVVNTVTEEDRAHLRIWEHLYNRRAQGVREFHDKFVATIPVKQSLLELVQLLGKNSRTEWLDGHQLSATLSKKADTIEVKQQQAKARDLLIWAIKGS